MQFVEAVATRAEASPWRKFPEPPASMALQSEQYDESSCASSVDFSAQIRYFTPHKNENSLKDVSDYDFLNLLS